MTTTTSDRATTAPGSAGSAGPTTRAAMQRTYAGPEHIAVQTVPRPVPHEGEVLIHVHAAGVDRGVWHMATGRPFLMRAMGFGLTRPRQPIQGTDVAGIVAAVGRGVTRFAVGDAVMGSARGSFALHAVASQDTLVHVPTGLDLDLAAAAAVSGIAAQSAVAEIGAVQDGQRVLVLGASGGVGSFAVQIAANAGADVTGVCSAGKAPLVKELGATVTIDYATEDVTGLDGSFDLIIDAGGLTPLRRLRRILAPAGTLVIVGGEGGGALTGGFGRQLRAAAMSLVSRQRLTFVMSETTRPALEQLAGRIARKEVSPAVTARYPLDRAADAVVDLTAGRIAGKAILTMGADR